MNAAITATENGVSHQPDAVTLTKAALEAHLKSCGTCRSEYCPTAMHLDAAARPDRSWINDYETGA